jgi:acetyl esterase/lipase
MRVAARGFKGWPGAAGDSAGVISAWPARAIGFGRGSRTQLAGRGGPGAAEQDGVAGMGHSSATRGRGAAACLAVIGAALFGDMAAARAAEPPVPPMAPSARPDLPLGIRLGLGGGDASEQWSMAGDWPVVRNVTAASLTPVLPPAGHGNGAAVIVAPGGGFLSLSMGTEGFAVAKWLAARGTAAFVLKYRLIVTPPDAAGFQAMADRKFARAMQEQPPSAEELEVPAASIADAQAAVRLVRAQAGAFHVDPARVGFIGFSAGAMLAIATALQSPADARPDFIAPIYPPLVAQPATADAPPMFVAIAADDALFGRTGFGLVESWRKAGRPFELHMYEKGGHGFGMLPTGTTSEDFILAFQHWMDMHGWTGAKMAPPT